MVKRNGKINIVTGIISPADVNEIKNILFEIGPEFTVITDTSESLNAPLTGEVSFLPLNGTSVEEITELCKCMWNHIIIKTRRLCRQISGKKIRGKIDIRTSSCGCTKYRYFHKFTLLNLRVLKYPKLLRMIVEDF